MSAHRTRSAVAASALTLLGLAFGTTAAQAAGATIVLPDDIVQISKPFTVSGTCVTGSRSAVVTVTQDGHTVASEAADLTGDLDYTATLDISSADEGEARAMVACFTYPDRDPVATAAETFFAFDGALPYSVDDVTVSPTKVAIGASATVTATCEPGTSVATVLLGNSDADGPFAEQETTPAEDGSVKAVVKIALDPDVVDGEAPKAGDAIAVVFCGDMTDPESEGGSGIGIGEFTILRAASTTPSPSPSPSPSSPGTAAAGGANDPDAAGGLANTGAQTAPLTAMAGVLLLGGLGLHRMRRRISAH